MNNQCPYCLARLRQSDGRAADDQITKDHVFPDFLGGTRKIPACRKCNNERFGSGFEAQVSKDIAPIVVFLSFSGYKHNRLVVHKRAWIDEATGIEYDMDSEGYSYPNKPHLIPENGKLKRIVARSQKEARKIAVSLKTKGKIRDFLERHESVVRPQSPLRNVQINVGAELRQLAVKMCMAVGQLVVPDIVLVEEQCRRFLLEKVPRSSPVRLVHSCYPSLDALRPALAHVVYIEGDFHSRKCFGVVQLFGGAFQFYAPLNNSYSGRNFAALGTLDVATFAEQFKEIDRLNLPEAPKIVGQDVVERWFAEWGKDFNSQVHAAFGKNEILFGTSQTQSLAGVQLTVPLLWVEHEVEIHLDLELLPDREPINDIQLPNHPGQWNFSADYGTTKLAVFDTFVEKWNKKLLKREVGQEHVYIPQEIVSGVKLLMGEDFWYPVQSVSISYRVIRLGWLSSVTLAQCSGALDQAQHSLKAKVRITQKDIPQVRDPSWPPIADPDGFLAAVEDVLLVERTDIDKDSFRFTEFRIGEN